MRQKEKPNIENGPIAAKESDLPLSFPTSIPDEAFKTIQLKEALSHEMQKELTEFEIMTVILPTPIEQELLDQESVISSNVSPPFKNVQREERSEAETRSIAAEKKTEKNEGYETAEVKGALLEGLQKGPPRLEVVSDKVIISIEQYLMGQELEQRNPPEPIPPMTEKIEVNRFEFEFVPYTSFRQSEESQVPQSFQEEWPETKRTTGIPLVMNRRTERYIEAFQNAIRPRFELWLSRSTKYGPIIEKILREFDLPEELLYLALIESGFNPRARSPKKALGPWQFMRSTARTYGLKINWWIDERRDIEKSTRAAARYLKHLYERFQNWELAIAAYNAGEGKIARAIRRYRTKDFWRLRRYRFLSRETRDFVSKFMAVMAIAKDLAAYGFSDLQFMEPLSYEEITLNGATDLRLIAKVIDCDVKTLKELNPQIKRGYIPSNARGFLLKIPQGKSALYFKNLPEMTANGTKTYERHTIRFGESLSTIAKRYRTSIKALMDLNNLRNSHLIIAGKSILVPIPSNSNNRRTTHLEKAALSHQSHHNPTIRKGDLLYRVREGDTLWKIAKQYGLSVSAICEWNNIKDHSVIYPGDQLILRIGSL